MSKSVNKTTCPYCFLDIDVNHQRSKLAFAAAFVHSTDSRYGFSSKDIRKLGGSELSRIEDLISTDHEWSEKLGKSNGVEVRPPTYGNRIIIKLYWDIAPIACENFATLCTNGNTTLEKENNHNNTNTATSSKKVKIPMGQSGKPLSYKDSIIHRVVPNFIMQGGDFVFGNGSGGESIYNGKKFKDERSGLLRKHDKRGIVSMGNSGKNSNTSQFFITFQDQTPQCDGKHVIFGEVISGFDVLDAIERFGSKDGEPTVPIQITDCGAFHPFITPGAGYWFDQPDEDSFDGFTPVFMVKPRVAIITPTKPVFEKFHKFLSQYVTSIPMILDENDSKCTKENICESVTELFVDHKIDLIIVAPVFEELFESFELPDAWRNKTNENIFVVKPVDALDELKRRWIME